MVRWVNPHPVLLRRGESPDAPPLTRGERAAGRCGSDGGRTTRFGAEAFRVTSRKGIPALDKADGLSDSCWQFSAISAQIPNCSVTGSAGA